MAAEPPPPPPEPPAIPGCLIVQGSGTTLVFPSGQTEVIVGREDLPAGALPEIDLAPHGGEEGGVSRRHARIFAHGAQVLIEDLNSTNGTFVNRQRLLPGRPQPLNHGDSIRLGRIALLFHRRPGPT